MISKMISKARKLVPSPLRRVASEYRTATRARAMACAALAHMPKWEGQWCHDCGEASAAVPGENWPDFEAFFDSRSQGRGVWKWRHYFEVYERHLRKFAGKRSRLVEVGVFSGGSIDMWRTCLGHGCEVVGVDVEPACQAYEAPGVRIFIGDQADRAFWRRLKADVGPVDVVIDDGGHLPDQQITTMEEMLPQLRPGGVYICEDVHGLENDFMEYLNGMLRGLNAHTPGQATPTTAYQGAVHSVHMYPYLIVVERTDSPRPELTAPRHGTEWQPFPPGPHATPSSRRHHEP